MRQGDAAPRDGMEQAGVRGRRPLCPDDVYTLRTVTDAQISPDGQRVAYVVRIADRDLGRDRSAIWVVDLEDGSPRQVTAGLREDAQPRWSPDGRWLAFTSDRGPVAPGRSRPARNLFLLDIAGGGEARQVTRFEDDVSHETVVPKICEAYAWSPDSRQICFVVKDAWPEGARPPRAYVYDKLRYKSGEDGWWDGRRKHLWLVLVEDGSVRQLTFGDWDDYGPSFSPDGSMIAYLSARSFADEQRNTLPDTNPGAPRDIWLVSVDGISEPCCLTDGDGPQLSPCFSPDGGMIAYYGHRDRYAAWNTPAHLWARPLSGGEPRDLIQGWDSPVGSCLYGDYHAMLAPPAAAWSPDGKTLYFLGTEHGVSNIYSVSAGGGAPASVTAGDHAIVTASFDRQRRHYAAVIQNDTTPSEVYVGEVGGELRRITNVNGRILAKVDTAKTERFTYEATDGTLLGGLILKPPGFDPRRHYPLVVELQGGMMFAHGAAFCLEYQVLAGSGHVVFLFNPRRFGYPPRWVEQNHGDLMAGVDYLMSQGYIDGWRLGITGDAGGGTVTNWTIGHTNRFAASATRRAQSNLFSFYDTYDRAAVGLPRSPEHYHNPGALMEPSAISYVDRVTTPHLLVQSASDHRNPATQSEQFFVALRSLGKTARLVMMTGDVHFLGRDGSPEDRVTFLEQVKEWFDLHLRPTTAAATDS